MKKMRQRQIDTVGTIFIGTKWKENILSNKANWYLDSAAQENDP